MIKGLVALAIADKYPGAAEGFINYQKEVDARKAKLQEKLEARMLAIQKLMISRGVSNSKVKTYSTDVATVVNRLRIKQGENAGKLVGGSEIIIQALRNDPSSSKVLKSMIEKEFGLDDMLQEEFNMIRENNKMLIESANMGDSRDAV